MRLTQNEIKSMIAVFGSIVSETCELRLFGSRVDDNAKGGDIDLLLVVPSDTDKSQYLYNKATILNNLKNEIGDQKIDLTIATSNDLSTDPFLQSIYPASIIIHHF